MTRPSDKRPIPSTFVRPLTRRSFLKAGACLGAGAALGLSGCSNAGETPSSSFDAETHARRGFAPDTEVKDYPVHLKVYVDADLRYYSSTEGRETHFDDYAAGYQENNDRSDVTFEFVYVDSSELLAAAREGFGDGDGIIGLADTVTAGNEAGTVDGGAADYMVRDISYNCPVECVMVRAKGSDAMLPPARTIDGEDTPGGEFNRLQQLPEYDGIVALADPTVEVEGVSANQQLAHQSFYSTYDGVGGYYDERIASKLRMYPTQDAAMEAITSGACQLGFALNWMIGSRYPDIEKCYDPAGGTISISAAALARSPEPGVMRDFFQYITECTW